MAAMWQGGMAVEPAEAPACDGQGAVSRQLAAPGGSRGERVAGRSTGMQLAAETMEQEPGGTAVSPSNQASTLLSIL